MSKCHCQFANNMMSKWLRIAAISLFFNFLSLSKHKANTTELHPKVRQTCYAMHLIGRGWTLDENHLCNYVDISGLLSDFIITSFHSMQ